MQDETFSLDVDIFSVGKQQLWDWCAGYNPYNPERLRCYADSLAKGLYVVVEGYARFGHMGHKSSVVTSTRSLRKALNIVMDYMRADKNICTSAKGTLYAHEYEIWHIVDDAQLWDEWERLAAANDVDKQRDAVTCTDCGARVPWHRAIVHPLIPSGGREYRCPTCERRFIDEDGYMLSPRDWAFHVFECSAPIRCACCGDAEYGPWVPYDRGKESFYLCESCSELYETLCKLGLGTNAHPDYKSVRTV